MLVWTLTAAGQGVAASVSEAVPFELSSPVLQSLGDLQEDWFDWLAAYYRGDEEGASTALANLLAGARELGMARLPDLSLGAAAAAVRLAADGDFEKAQQGIHAARQLDPGLPDVEFAAARVARLEGHHLTAAMRWLGGYARLLRAPLKRSLWLSNLALWMISALLLTGVAFVMLEMATKGVHLLGDLLAFLGRFMPLLLAYVVAVALLIWPLFLPSGPLWLVIYWSLLIWGYGTRSEQIVLIGLWILVAVAPVLVKELRQRVGETLFPEFRTLESLRHGRLEGALFSDLAALRATLPDSTAVTHLLADLNLSLGQWEAALDLYLEVLEAEPGTPTALADVGVCFFYRGDFEEAIDYFRRASEYEVSSAAAHFNLSQTYSEMYRFDDAGRDLRAAQEIDNEAVGNWIVRAVEERVVALGGGIGRADEIRSEFLGSWHSGEIKPDWGSPWRQTLLLPVAPVFILAAVGVHLLRRRSQGRREPPARWWDGPSDFVRRVLLPGLAEAEEGRWVWAYLALLVPVALATLPFLGHFGYAVPWGFGPPRFFHWLVAGVGLVLYFALRLARELRDRV